MHACMCVCIYIYIYILIVYTVNPQEEGAHDYECFTICLNQQAVPQHWLSPMGMTGRIKIIVFASGMLDTHNDLTYLHVTHISRYVDA